MASSVKNNMIQARIRSARPKSLCIQRTDNSISDVATVNRPWSSYNVGGKSIAEL